MIAIILAVLLAFVLQLAIWEGVVLGAAWLIGKLADINVNYPLIGGIVFGVWIVVLAVKILFIYGAHRLEKKADAEFEARRRKFDTRFEELRKRSRGL